MSFFQNTTVVIVFHDWTHGPPHELRDFILSDNPFMVIAIHHRNLCVKNNTVKASYAEIFQDGFAPRIIYSNEMNLPEPLAYIKDSVLTFYWSLKYAQRPIDYFFGVGNMNAFCGLLLKKIGKVWKVVYYVIDYIPNRFHVPFFNNFYHYIDKLCAFHSDATWNYAKAMIQERSKRWLQIFPRQQVVPNGVQIHPDVYVPWTKAHKHECVYVGSLSEQQGIQLVIKAISQLKHSIRDIRFMIIGMGSYDFQLKELVKKMHCSKHIIWKGYVREYDEMEKMIAHAAFGVATYVPNTGFVQYTEPGKVKLYLSCGLPVLMTNISPLAKDIRKTQCGWVCSYTVADVVRSMRSIFLNQTHMGQIRRNAVQFAARYTWKKIFFHAMQSMTDAPV